MNLSLVFRRAGREWRQLAALAFSVSLVTAFFALGPLYTRAMIQAGLQFEIGQVNPARLSLTFTSPEPIRPASWGLIVDQLRDLTGELTRVARSGAAFGGFQYQYGEPTTEFTGRSEFANHAYAFSNLRSVLKLVDGRWPERLAPPDSPERRAASEQEALDKGLGMYSTGDVEAVISTEVARRTGYGLGTRFAIGERPDQRVVVHVVGIVEAANPADAFWVTNNRALTGAEVQVGLTEVAFQLAFIVTEGAYTDWVAQATRLRTGENNNYVWDVRLNGGAVNADNVADVQRRLDFLAKRMAADYPGLSVNNPLLRILNRYNDVIGKVEGPVVLVSGAVLVLMLYHLVTTVTLALESRAEEWAALSSRGASTRQLVQMQGLTMLVLCVIGAAAGPLMAYLILQALLLAGPLQAVTGGVLPIGGIPALAFVLSAAAALASLFMLTLPALPAARRSLAQFKQTAARPPARPAWARFGLDFLLIVVGLGFVARLLFFVEGDLGNTISLLFSNPRALIQIIIDSAARTGGLADPLNLIGPAFVLTGFALLWLRLFPILMRVFAALTRRARGLTAPLSLWTVERDPGHYAQLVLLLIGTLALGTAALGLVTTRDNGVWAAAKTATGGAVRVQTDGKTPLNAAEWAALPGVSGAVALSRFESVQQAGTQQTFIIGLSPTEMAATFPEWAEAVQPLIGAAVQRERTFIRRTRTVAEISIYPVVISERYARDLGRAQRQDQQPLIVGNIGRADVLVSPAVNVTLYFRVMGIVRTFPSLAENQYFVLMETPNLRAFIENEPTAVLVPRPAPNQVWLEVSDRRPDPALIAAIEARPEVTTVTAAWDSYGELLREPLPAAIAGMLYAGFWVSLLLSLLDFAFYLSVTAKRRSVGFAVLQALGWNLNKIWALLAAEHAALVIPALVVGIGLGAGLAYVILPFLALVGGVPLALPPMGVIGLVAALVGGFTVLLVVAASWLRRLNVNRVLRLGEE